MVLVETYISSARCELLVDKVREASLNFRKCVRVEIDVDVILDLLSECPAYRLAIRRLVGQVPVMDVIPRRSSRPFIAVLHDHFVLSITLGETHRQHVDGSRAARRSGVDHTLGTIQQLLPGKFSQRLSRLSYAGT